LFEIILTNIRYQLTGQQKHVLEERVHQFDTHDKK